MIKILNLISIIITITGCTSNHKTAILEDKQDFLFTKHGTMQIIRLTSDDTLESIAIQYKVPVEILASINSITSPYYLNNRRNLLIPQDKYYKISKNNESITTIARQHHISSYAVQELNNWLYSEQEILPKGTLIRLPREIIQSRNDYEVMELEEVPEEPMQNIEQEQSLEATIEEESLNFQVPQEKAKEKEIQLELPKLPFKLATPLNLPHFIWPLQEEITVEKNSEGVIIYAQLDTPIKAIGKGKVIYSDNDKGEYGNLIIIKHSDGYLSAYAHNNKLLVKKGDTVVKGQTIAKVGQSGNAKKPQVFFSMRKGKNNINPDQTL